MKPFLYYFLSKVLFIQISLKGRILALASILLLLCVSVSQAATLSKVTVSPTSVNGGTSSTGTVTLSANASTGGEVVSLASNNAAASVPSSVTVAAGSKTKTFTVTTIAVASNQSVTLTASKSGSSNKTKTLTVKAPALSSVSVSPSSVNGGGSATGTVTLNVAAVGTGTVVTLSSNDAAASVPASVTVTVGNTQATFPISTTPVAANTSVTLTGIGNGVTKTKTLTVKSPVLTDLTLSTGYLSGGSSNPVTAAITLSGNAPLGGIVVTISSDNVAAIVPSTVTIPAGESSQTFTISTLATAYSVDGEISATYNNVTKSYYLTVTGINFTIPVPTGGDGKADINFYEVSDVESYIVKRSTVSGGPYTSVATINSPQFIDGRADYIDTGLVNGTTYFYVMATVRDGVESVDSPQNSCTPQPIIVPSDLAASSACGGIKLTWTYPTSSGYELVMRSTQFGGPYSGVGSGDSGNYFDTTAQPGVRYYYVIRVVGWLGETQDSNEVSSVGISAAATLTASAGEGSVHLFFYWNSPGISWCTYEVCRATNIDGPYTTLVTSGVWQSVTGASYTDYTVQNGTTYYYKISGQFYPDWQSGQSPGNPVSIPDSNIVTTTPSDHPTYLNATSNGTIVLLEWDPHFQLSQFDVKRSSQPGGPYTIIGISDNNNNPDNFYIDNDPNLVPGQTYYYVVSEVPEGEVADSPEASVTLVNGPPIAITLNPAVDSSALTSEPQVNLTWNFNAKNSLKEYKLYRATHPNVTLGDSLLTTLPGYPSYGGWYNDHPLNTTDPNLTYYYRVFVVDSAGQSIGSNEVSYIPPPVAPGMPDFNNIGLNSVQVTMPDLPVRATFLTLQMKQASQDDSAYIDVTTDQLAFAVVTINNLIATTDYTFRVIAVGPTGITASQSAGLSPGNAPLAPDVPTFSDLTPDNVVVNGPALPAGTSYLRMEMKQTGQDDSDYVTVIDNLEANSTTLVDGLSNSDDLSYEFRFVSVGDGGETPGSSAQLLISNVKYGWDVGTDINCDGIRWPEDNATITAVSAGRLSSFLARDWDTRNVLQGSTVIGSSLITDPCSYTWSAKFNDGTPAGSFPNGNTGQSVVWIAPTTLGTVTLYLVIDDQNSLNKGNGESGARDDATLGFNDDPVTFSRSIDVQ